MPKLTRLENEKLKRLVRECEVFNFSRQESVEYIRTRMNRTISVRTLNRIQKRLKAEAKRRIEEFKQGEFLSEAYERFVEIKDNHRSLLELKEQARKIEDVAARVKTIRSLDRDLANLTMKMVSLLDTLPFAGALQERLEKENKGSESP